MTDEKTEEPQEPEEKQPVSEEEEPTEPRPEPEKPSPQWAPPDVPRPARRFPPLNATALRKRGLTRKKDLLISLRDSPATQSRPARR